MKVGTAFRRSVLLVFAALAGCATAPKRPPDLEAGFARMQAAPEQAEGYLMLARAYVQRGDLLRARQYLTLAERHASEAERESGAIFQLGVVIAVRSGQHEEAITRCRDALAAREDSRVRRLLAALLEGHGRLEEAEAQWRRLLAHRGADGDLHLLIEAARFYTRAGRPDSEARAAALYGRYLKEAPQGPDAERARAALRELPTAPETQTGTN